MTEAKNCMTLKAYLDQQLEFAQREMTLFMTHTGDLRAKLGDERFKYTVESLQARIAMLERHCKMYQ